MFGPSFFTVNLKARENIYFPRLLHTTFVAKITHFLAGSLHVGHLTSSSLSFGLLLLLFRLVLLLFAPHDVDDEEPPPLLVLFRGGLLFHVLAAGRALLADPLLEGCVVAAGPGGTLGTTKLLLLLAGCDVDEAYVLLLVLLFPLEFRVVFDRLDKDVLTFMTISSAIQRAFRNSESHTMQLMYVLSTAFPAVKSANMLICRNLNQNFLLPHLLHTDGSTFISFMFPGSHITCLHAGFPKQLRKYPALSFFVRNVILNLSHLGHLKVSSMIADVLADAAGGARGASLNLLQQHNA